MILRTKGVTIGALGTKRHSKEILRETLASQTLAKLLVQVVYFGLGVLASRGTVRPLAWRWQPRRRSLI